MKKHETKCIKFCFSLFEAVFLSYCNKNILQYFFAFITFAAKNEQFFGELICRKIK